MRKVEDFAASLFERFAPDVLDREVGVRTWRNGEDGSGIRVDWTYDSATPAAALEVTALHLPGEPQILSELEKKLTPELHSLIREERLGEWLVVVDVAANVKQLVPELKSLIREGRPIRVGNYTSKDLREADALSVTGIHRRMEGLGLVELARKGGGGNSVEWMVTGGGPEIVGFTERLEQAVQDNRDKLRLEKYESHLAVVVFDFQMSRTPDRTRPPALGTDLDYIWVMHSWQGPTGRAEVWVVEAGGAEWSRRSWS